jgi:hypothetical protein
MGVHTKYFLTSRTVKDFSHKRYLVAAGILLIVQPIARVKSTSGF